MAYTAIENMRNKNEVRFGADVGPYQPPLYQNRACLQDLKSAALRFIHERCEGLLFDPEKEAEEQRTGVFLGKSLSAGQIPYNMEMDIDRLCLEKALEAFIDSGVAEDAYTVYYCYLEMFLGRYGNSKRMVELLSEYEANGSSLLMKHRDHYSHSVYVFALGLAIYETNAAYRHSFQSFYRLEDQEENGRANLFLEYWGLTALFHDIGYPFELPFEQVLSYFEVDHQERGKGSLYLAYHDVEALTGLDEAAKDRFETLYGKRFETVSALLAHDLAQKLGAVYDFSEDYLLDVLDRNQGVDAVVFDLVHVDEAGNELRYVRGTEHESEFSFASDPTFLFSPHNAVNKLWRRELFLSSGIRFPDRMWFEDLATVPKLCLRLERILPVPQAWYRYYQRPGSIMSAAQAARNLDMLPVAETVEHYYRGENAFERYLPELTYKFWYEELLASVTRVNRIDLHSEIQGQLRDDYLRRYPEYRHSPYVRHAPLHLRLLADAICRSDWRVVRLMTDLNNKRKGR